MVGEVAAVVLSSLVLAPDAAMNEVQTDDAYAGPVGPGVLHVGREGGCFDIEGLRFRKGDGQDSVNFGVSNPRPFQREV